MEYAILAKVSKKGDPCRQPGDIIGGKKTGICKEDGWGIIGRCMIKISLRIPEESILHIWGEKGFKEVKILKGIPKKKHRNLYRFVSTGKANLGEKNPTPVIRVIPLSFET